jgi:hypothetical protein
MTKKSIEQAKAAFTTFMSAARQATSQFEDRVADMFTFAGRLVHAKDIQQVICAADRIRSDADDGTRGAGKGARRSRIQARHENRADEVLTIGGRGRPFFGHYLRTGRLIACTSARVCGATRMADRCCRSRGGDRRARRTESAEWLESARGAEGLAGADAETAVRSHRSCGYSQLLLSA